MSVEDLKRTLAPRSLGQIPAKNPATDPRHIPNTGPHNPILYFPQSRASPFSQTRPEARPNTWVTVIPRAIEWVSRPRGKVSLGGVVLSVWETERHDRQELITSEKATARLAFFCFFFLHNEGPLGLFRMIRMTK